MCCEPDESVTRADAGGSDREAAGRADRAVDRAPSAGADPGAATPPAGETMDRRAWMSRLSLALGAVAATIVGLPVVGFIFAPFFGAKPERWRTVGHLSRFPVGTTTVVRFEDPSPLRWAGQVAETAAWLRREGESEFIAFSIDCTHLGCPVRWEERANLFMCPCHGGVYYSNGNVAGGPPPHPLPRYPVRVRGGAVEVRTTPLPITT